MTVEYEWGLDTYLSTLFTEFNMELSAIDNQFLAVYGDKIPPQLTTPIAHYQLPSDNENSVKRLFASVRQSAEHKFSIYTKIFGLFSIPQRFKLLVYGLECYRITFNSFFLMNC